MGTAGARRRLEQVEKLLVGESLDTSSLAYDFDAQHVGLVAAGPAATIAVRQLAAERPHLILETPGNVAWGWLAGDSSAFALGPFPGTHLGVGEPAPGLAGWRLTHRQARAALSVASRGGESTVRYADAALLASALRDELLATSLRRLYLEPLEEDSDGGEELRRTLGVYLASDRNASIAGKAIGITRQAVTRRVRSAEQKLGRPLAACAAELELALSLEALDPAPMPLSAP